MGLFSNISSNLPTIVQNAAGNVLAGQAQKYLPAGIGSKIGSITSIGSALASGNLSAAASAVLGSGLLNGVLGKGAGALSSVLYQSTPNELLGGLTPLAAKQLYSYGTATKYARKNLFFVQLTPISGEGGTLEGNGPRTINIFCTEVSYAPWTVTGMKHQIGSASVDTVQNGEPTELRLTTLDDSKGSVKKFFRKMALKAARPDGTVGVPKDYLMKFRVLHAFVSDATNSASGYEDTLLVRAGSIELDLSRRDDQMQEIQLTFVEHDTFYPA